METSSKGRNTQFIKRVWLNDPDSPSTGSVVAYDGEVIDHDQEPYRSTFLKVSDCHVSAHIHKASYDTDKEFIDKMKRFRDVLNEFINRLETAHPE
jgi:hypothetical protein